MIVKRLAGALALGAALGWTCPAFSDPKRVAVIDAAVDDVVVIRIRAELAASGFTVVEVEGWAEGAASSEVAAALAPAGAVAAVRIKDDGAEVWLIDARRRTPSLCEVVRAAPAEGTGDPTLAVRAVEVVRAELSGARARKRRHHPIGEETIADTSPPPPAERRQLSFDLGFGFSAAPGGIPVASAFVAGARYMPIDHLGVAAVAVASPFHSTVEEREGETSVWTGLAGAGIAVEATSPRSAWGFIIEAGVAGGWLHLEGEAAPGFRGQSDTLAVVAPYLRPSLRWRPTPAFALRLDVVGAVAFPRPVISFAGREVATWGRPVIVGSLGVEVSP